MKRFVVLIALIAFVPIAAQATTLPINFWSDDLTLDRAQAFVVEMNAIYQQKNNTGLRFVLGIAGPTRTCNNLGGVGGVNVTFVPKDELPPGWLEAAPANALPLGPGSSFCSRAWDGLLTLTPPSWYPKNWLARIFVHVTGHNLGLTTHTPGTPMSLVLEDATEEFEPWQVDVLNQGATQAATATKAGLPGMLLGNRFVVSALWKTAQGEGSGSPVALTADSGYLWFFDAANIELTVKVLDGCGLNAHYWVFAAGMTNVEVTLTVTDTETGAVRTYTNPSGKAFLPIQDTNALATCE